MYSNGSRKAILDLFTIGERVVADDEEDDEENNDLEDSSERENVGRRRSFGEEVLVFFGKIFFGEQEVYFSENIGRFKEECFSM